jgi:hypothetical protein
VTEPQRQVATTNATHRRPKNRPCTHATYLLSCDGYDELLDFTGNRCQVCGTGPKSAGDGVLFIDHDGMLGQWAVRGLLCQVCNVRVEWPHLRGPAGDEYLANPWYRRLLDRAGIEGVTIPEPALGWYVTAGNILYHRSEGGWQSHRRPKLPPLPITWQKLCYTKGPHNIKVGGLWAL